LWSLMNFSKLLEDAIGKTKEQRGYTHFTSR